MEFEITLIFPVYNGIESLPRLFEYLQKYLKSASLKSCVFLIDEGSDGRASTIERFCLEYTDFYSLLFDKNYGKDAVLKAGFDRTKTSLLGYLDVDLQTYPENFQLLFLYIKKFGLVTGGRNNNKDTFDKCISSKAANTIRLFFTHDNIHDTGYSLKIMHTENVRKIPMFKSLQRFLPAMVFLQEKRIKKALISYHSRIEGQLKYNFKNRFFSPDCFIPLWIKKSYIDYKIRVNHG